MDRSAILSNCCQLSIQSIHRCFAVPTRTHFSPRLEHGELLIFLRIKIVRQTKMSQVIGELSFIEILVINDFGKHSMAFIGDVLSNTNCFMQKKFSKPYIASV